MLDWLLGPRFTKIETRVQLLRQPIVLGREFSRHLSSRALELTRHRDGEPERRADLDASGLATSSWLARALLAFCISSRLRRGGILLVDCGAASPRKARCAGSGIDHVSPSSSLSAVGAST